MSFPNKDRNIRKEFKKIAEEVLRRLNGKHCNNNITGIEIKLRRILKRLTLAELAEDVCSISYLCKVEQSQIKPNYVFLNDICSRLDMDDDAIDALMNLEKELENMVDAYFTKDKAKMDKIILKGKGLENYRYKIIEFIYYIYTSELELADDLAVEIKELTSVLNDIDLLVFAVFYDILYFNLVGNEEIYKELSAVEKLIPIENNLRYIIASLKIRCLFTMNSPLIVKKIDLLVTSYLNIARFDLIDEIRYVLALYYLFNNESHEYEMTKNLITSKTLIKSLEIYKKVINKEKIYLKDLNNTLDYTYLVGLATIDGEKAKEAFERKNLYNSTIEYDETIIEYLSLKTVEEKYNFISFIALPSLKLNNNKMVAKFYERELLLITQKTSKYKLFYEFLMEMNS